MRKLALLAFFYCAFSYAADRWLEMPNNAGGKIMLFNTKCSGTDDGKMVIATTPQGTNVTGCWWYFAEMVHVVWKSGDTSSFDVNGFKIREGK